MSLAPVMVRGLQGATIPYNLLLLSRRRSSGRISLTPALAISNQAGTPRFALNINADGSWLTYDRASGTYQPGIAQRGGRVGIAKTDPTGGGVVDSKLTVRNADNTTGIAILNQANARRFALNTGGDGSWTIFDGGGGAWNSGLRQMLGNIGIGTAPTTSKLEVLTTASGSTPASSFKVTNILAIAPAVRAEVNTQYGNFRAAAVFGISSGTGGWRASHPSGNGPALIAIAEGNGNGVTANATSVGDGVESSADGTGAAVYGWIPTFSSGTAGRFVIFNTTNSNPAMNVRHHGTGSGLTVDHVGSSGAIATFRSGPYNGAQVNVARIDKTGRGFFNNGTQTGGADVAESFAVVGDVSAYEPGDVFEISPDHARTLRKSAEAYPTRVLGVYATKPGVLLSDLSIDDDHGSRVPAGVVGVIPTKVTTENGVIRPGDLLVAASTPGHAMKAGAQAPAGSIIGKALAAFSGDGAGLIDVFVNVR